MTLFAIMVLAALLLFGLGAAALSLRTAGSERGTLTFFLMPVALLVAVVVILAIGGPEPGILLRLAPFVAGTLVALLTGQLGYGLLAGLVVAAASSAA